MDRLKLFLESSQWEKEQIINKVRKYLKEHKEDKTLQRTLVQSKMIEEVISEEEVPSAELTVPEKTELIMMFNKRLSQLNNTKEKSVQIANLLIQYISQRGLHQKTEAFLDMLFNRITEQIKVQVSANKASSNGYSFFLQSLSQHIPITIHRYKKYLFKSILPLETLLGMYRVYFNLLRDTNNTQEAWEFIASLLNHKSIQDSFNPSVLNVYLDVLNTTMQREYPNGWSKLLKCILEEYLPRIPPRLFSMEIQCIKDTLQKR
ncbi:hypothetical protein NEOKW01_0816 [Nematocida sp. AWRm80]|nr:hypothetical protein NEOKW01_0816 [Nematocida sp. AWRm80]